MAVVASPRICPFCESSCGLIVEADAQAGEIVRIKGDPAHPTSRGFVCAKSQGLIGLRKDPDRLTRPLRRQGNDFIEIDWDEALDRAVAGLNKIRARDGLSGLGIYLGNPGSHNAGIMLGISALLTAMPTLMVSAASIDSFPRFLVDIFLYGNQARCPVPDVDRTGYFLIFGANPMVSNGSMMGAPNMPARLRALKHRGGRLMVVDPRRTETAAIADDHFAIRPGTDALMVMAMIDTLFREQRVKMDRLAELTQGLEALRNIASAYPAERVAPLTGIDAERIRSLTREFAAAPTAVAYGRVGTCCQPFGTLATWLIDCLNILTGNLDREGGALFPLPVMPSILTHAAYEGETAPYAQFRSRVSNTPAVGPSFPTHVLWEEIETPGAGQIRGLVSIAGNPAVSNQNAGRVAAALKQLEFMVSVDIYLNETTRHADIILPPMEHLKRAEHTVIYGEWMVESAVVYSAPVFVRDPNDRSDWDILTGLSARMSNLDVETFVADYSRNFLGAVAPILPRRPDHLTADAMLVASAHHTQPEQLYDALLRTGPFGDGYGQVADGLTLDRLKQMPSGVSFGPMHAGRLPEILQTPDKRIALAPPVFAEDLARLEAAIASGRFAPDQFLLINRRDIRSNNSWFHNLPALMKGRDGCIALMNPSDATELGIETGDRVRLKSRVGTIELPIETSDSVRPRVICVPHGWGHEDELVRLAVFRSKTSANVNMLSDDADYDRPSGNASFNGIPITVEVA
jgi:anaerobic selenocysteine-containing dehydrogenase